MAFLENRNGNYRIKFRFEGKQFSRSLKTSNGAQAQLAKGQIERNLELVSLGLLEVPDDCDVFGFFLTGKVQGKPDSETRMKANRKNGNRGLSIERLFKTYFDAFLESK